MSLTRHYFHVFMPLPTPLVPATTCPLQPEIQSFTFLCSACPNHLNLPLLATSETFISKCFHSFIFILSFSSTLQIYLVIHFTTKHLQLNILGPVSIYGLSMLARVGRFPMSCNSPKRVADYSWVFWCEILQLDVLPANPTAAAMLKAAVNRTNVV